jgi:ferritin-like metal-binding protein YciE
MPKLLKDLFLDTLKDVYFAEQKIVGTLPVMEQAATNGQLKSAFRKHHDETGIHICRLEVIFSVIGAEPDATPCDPILGITDEGADIMEEYEASPALDAGLLAVAQALEHYEITKYGSLRSWALVLGYEEAAKILHATLDEEKAASLAYTAIAASVVKQIAGHQANRVSSPAHV